MKFILNKSQTKQALGGVLFALALFNLGNSALASNVTAVPAGFKECAKDFGKCEVKGAWTGYYGANNNFVPISGTGTFTCLPNDLKVADPVPGVQKGCYINAAAMNALPDGFKECAKDFGKCEVTGAWTGYYGANNTYVSISGTGSFTCLPGDLKVADPVPNVQKACHIQVTPVAQAPTPTPTPVATPVPAAPVAVAPTPAQPYPALAIAAAKESEEKIRAMIATKQWDIEQKSSRGETALTIAVGYGNIGAVKALLDGGANVNATLKGGDHSFHILARGAADEQGYMVMIKDAEKIAKLLWQKCPYRRPRDSQGKTPLEVIQKKIRSGGGSSWASLGMEFDRIQKNAAPGCP